MDLLTVAAICGHDGFVDQSRFIASRRPMSFEHLCTHNDRNGNPRRLFVLCIGKRRVASWDEGYRGYKCVPACLQELAAAAEWKEVPPSCYFELRRNLPSPDDETLEACVMINGLLAA